MCAACTAVCAEPAAWWLGRAGLAAAAAAAGLSPCLCSESHLHFDLAAAAAAAAGLSPCPRPCPHLHFDLAGVCYFQAQGAGGWLRGRSWSQRNVGGWPTRTAWAVASKC